MISRAIPAPSAHHADTDAGRPPGYAYGCAHHPVRHGGGRPRQRPDCRPLGGSLCLAPIKNRSRSVSATLSRVFPADYALLVDGEFGAAERRRTTGNVLATCHVATMSSIALA